MASILRDEAPNATFIQAVDAKQNPQKSQPVCPPSLRSCVELTEEMDLSVGSQEEQMQSIVSALQVSEDKCQILEEEHVSSFKVHTRNPQKKFPDISLT